MSAGMLTFSSIPSKNPGLFVCVDTGTRVLRNVGDYLWAENCNLLGYCAASSGNFLPRRWNYKCLLCKTPGERRSQPLGGGRLKSHIYEVPGKFSVTAGEILRKETKQFTVIRCVTSQQTALFILTVVRTANVTSVWKFWHFEMARYWENFVSKEWCQNYFFIFFH